jgi:integrase
MRNESVSLSLTRSGGLTWADVNDAAVTIPAGLAKTGRARAIPRVGAIADVLTRREKRRSVKTPLVFHARGYGLHGANGGFRRRFRGLWRAACIAAGHPTLLSYDLRRSAVRAFAQAGVPQAVAMQLSGHRTDSVFRRYSIVTGSDTSAALLAVAALPTGKGTGAVPLKKPVRSPANSPANSPLRRGGP